MAQTYRRLQKLHLEAANRFSMLPDHANLTNKEMPQIASLERLLCIYIIIWQGGSRFSFDRLFLHFSKLLILSLIQYFRLQHQAHWRR